MTSKFKPSRRTPLNSSLSDQEPRTTVLSRDGGCIWTHLGLDIVDSAGYPTCQRWGHDQHTLYVRMPLVMLSGVLTDIHVSLLQQGILPWTHVDPLSYHTLRQPAGLYFEMSR